MWKRLFAQLLLKSLHRVGASFPHADYEHVPDTERLDLGLRSPPDCEHMRLRAATGHSLFLSSTRQKRDSANAIPHP